MVSSLAPEPAVLPDEPGHLRLQLGDLLGQGLDHANECPTVQPFVLEDQQGLLPRQDALGAHPSEHPPKSLGGFVRSFKWSLGPTSLKDGI